MPRPLNVNELMEKRTMKQLRRENDELLAALYSIAEFENSADTYYEEYLNTCVQIAKKVIAKWKGRE